MFSSVDFEKFLILLHSHYNLLPSLFTYLLTYLLTYLAAAVEQWLRCCGTNRKVAGSIPAGESGNFH